MSPGTVSFAEFCAASPYRDPVDHKKLLFVYRALEDLAAERRGNARELRVLEIACGVGGITLSLARTGARVRALDIDAADVDALTVAAARAGFDNIEATVEDAFAFRTDERFDVVVASEVLEHVLDPEVMLANIVRHMAPDGLLIVTTPNGYGPWELSNFLRPRHLVRRWNWFRRLLGKPPYVTGTGPDHCQHFTHRNLVTLFQRSGLDVHRLMNSDFVFTVSKRLRRNRAVGSFDTEIANLVPHWMASGWYVALRRRNV